MEGCFSTGMRDRVTSRVEHGWPFTYLIRDSNPFEDGSPWDLSGDVLEVRLGSLWADVMAGLLMVCTLGWAFERWRPGQAALAGRHTARNSRDQRAARMCVPWWARHLFDTRQLAPRSWPVERLPMRAFDRASPYGSRTSQAPNYQSRADSRDLRGRRTGWQILNRRRPYKICCAWSRQSIFKPVQATSPG